jgi:hypothetical protein
MEILAALLGVLILLGVPVGIITGIVMLVRRSRVFDPGTLPGAQTELGGSGTRVFAYVLLFIGIMGVLFGVAELLALLAVPLVPNASRLITADDVRTRASYDLASIVVGLPLAIGFWRYIAGRLREQPLELQAQSRRVFFGAMFVTTAATALYGAHQVIHAILTIGDAGNRVSNIRDLVEGGSLVVIYGATWLYSARLGWAERSSRGQDGAHDLAVAIVSAASFIYLFYGVTSLLGEIVRDVLGAGGATLLGGAWNTWADGITACIVGGVTFWCIQIYDLQRGGVRTARTVYLYVMLLWIVPLTVYSAIGLVYETVRRLFGYHDAFNNTGYLADNLPYILAGAAAWAFFWSIVRRAGMHAADPGAAIPYPRRPAIALFAVAGVALMAFGVITLLRLGVDAFVGSHSLSGSSWWRDDLSSALSLMVGGLALWFPAWSILQTAVEEAPVVERAARERRWLLSGIAMVSALAAVGAGVALLYYAWLAVLGSSQAGTLTDVLHAVAILVVALAIGAYHGLVLRDDMRRQPAPVKASLALLVLLGEGADDTLSTLISDLPVHIRPLGRLAPDVGPHPQVDPAKLRTQLEAMLAPGGATTALLVLQADGGNLYRYTAMGAVRDQHVPQVESRLDAPATATL